MQLDSRLRVFHKKNGGVSSARNVGLDNLKGEWVMFVDSDDMLPSGAIECLINKTNDSIDLVMGGIQKIDNDRCNIEYIPAGQDCICSKEDCIDKFIAPNKWVGDWQRYLWNRIYRVSIINRWRLRFRTDIFYKEDGLFIIDYLARCSKSVACTNDIVYLYRQVPNSAMGALNSSFNSKLFTNIDAHGEIIHVIKKMGVSKSIIKREEKHLVQNYYWIMSIMEKTGANNLTNRISLNNRILRNGGILNYIFFFVILKYGRMLKRRFA